MCKIPESKGGQRQTNDFWPGWQNTKCFLIEGLWRQREGHVSLVYNIYSPRPHILPTTSVMNCDY